MAARRVRIKGIANIPQRKKTNVDDKEPEDETAAGKSSGTPENECGGEPNLTSVSESHVEKDNEKDENNKPGGIKIISQEIIKTHDVTPPSNEEKEVKSVPIRRKFIKPQVAVNLVNRKKEKPPENVVVEPNKENVQESVNVNLNETVIAPSVAPVKSELQTPGPLSVKISPTVIAQKEISKCGSDTEYPPPPVSPSKLLNRRIKAIPRLHQRRTSFSIGSASESEDDSRRSTYSRVRNDSVCSVTSLAATDTQTSTKEATSPIRKDAPSNPPRKFRRSEQGRKLAEARRSFHQKFTDGKLDKQKLTMIDLIYYNPATNPMNPRKRKETTSSTIPENPPSPKEKPTAVIAEEEESVDDPNHTNSEEDDDDVLAPQIKVGPNGEIVIDEKSLVIENVETKKSRQALEMAEVIDGDYDTAYGVYKRVKRSKDWSNEETLRFYKALNTIGTDFTMMCELFPNRTRRELKLKFKREEKINKTLIDRAVMQPVEFDMNQLRKDLEQHERFVEEKRKRVQETWLAKEKQRERRLNRKGEKRKGLTGIDTVEIEDSEEVTVKRDHKPIKRKRKKKHPYDNLKKGINTLLEDTDDTDEEYKPNSTAKNKDAKRTTIPRDVKKPQKSQSPERESQENNAKDLEPGSLMIFPSVESGRTSYKVFMITEEHNKQEVEMDEETIEKIACNSSPQNNRKIVNIQNIITISEDEMEGSQVSASQNDDVEITQDSIIFPFDECPVPVNNNSNVTISHEDNKMTIVMES